MMLKRTLLLSVLFAIAVFPAQSEGKKESNPFSDPKSEFFLPKELSPAEKMVLSPPPSFSQLPPKVVADLLKGKVVTEIFKRKNRKNKMVYVTIARKIIKATPKEIFEQLSQLEQTHKYMPRLYYSKVKKQFSKNTFYVHRKLKVAWVKVNLHIWIKLTPYKKIEWRLFPNKKNDIKNTVGAFVLEPIKGGKETLVTYLLYTDSGRWVPGFIKKIMLRKDLPKVMKALEKRVLSGGKWEK